MISLKIWITLEINIFLYLQKKKKKNHKDLVQTFLQILKAWNPLGQHRMAFIFSDFSALRGERAPDSPRCMGGD